MASFSTDTRQVLSSINKIILGNNPSESNSAYTYNGNGSIDLKSYRYAQYKEGANGHPFNEDFSENTSYNWNGCYVSKSYMISPNGFHIVPASEHDFVEQEYTTKGIAWYYILDTVNKRFKLPRTKFGFTGLRTGVGNYVAPGLPNITAKMMGATSGSLADAYVNASGACRTEGSGGASAKGGEEFFLWKHDFDASRSSLIYGASNTVQPPATEMYLYFYVGNYTQTAIDQTAGLNAEMFNGKADTDLANVASNIDYVVESQINPDGSWYRKYKRGWIEQGGSLSYAEVVQAWELITLLKPMQDLNYNITIMPLSKYRSDTSAYAIMTSVGNKTTTSFLANCYGVSPVDQSVGFTWKAEGQGA